MPDTCDGFRMCLENHALEGTACGDTEGRGECDDPDSCDGFGICRDNLASIRRLCQKVTDSVCGKRMFCDGLREMCTPDDVSCEPSASPIMPSQLPSKFPTRYLIDDAADATLQPMPLSLEPTPPCYVWSTPSPACIKQPHP